MVETLNVYVDITRRHSFTHAMEHVPEGVTVHILPTGGQPRVRGLKALLSLEHTAERAELAYRASLVELDRIAGG